jgi:hypothetical protein
MSVVVVVVVVVVVAWVEMGGVGDDQLVAG